MRNFLFPLMVLSVLAVKVLHPLKAISLLHGKIVCASHRLEAAVLGCSGLHADFRACAVGASRHHSPIHEHTHHDLELWGKQGVQSIPWYKTEIDLNLPAYVQHNNPTGS